MTHSSTSNSEETLATSDEHGGSRGYYGKVLLAAVLAMAGAMGLVRLFAMANNASSASFLGRVLEARAALPRILEEPEPLVFFYGSSMVEAGFSPRQFDRELQQQGARLKTFNFGFGGLNPLFQEILARRIQESFEARDRRLELAMIEFNPFQTTITRRQGALAAEDSFVTLLSSEEELWQIFLEDPERGLLLYNIRYLRDGISAEIATNFLSQPFQAPRMRSTLEQNEEDAKRMRELGKQLNEAFKREYPNYEDAEWGYDWQGGGTIPEERSAETLAIFERYYEAQRTDYRLDNDRLNRIQTADILEMHFDEDLVVAFIQLVKHFQTFSDKVEVMMLPRNEAWITYTPEGRRRLDAVLARIERETGLKVHDFQQIEGIDPTKFSDTTHLNRYQGAVAFTQFLVDRYRDYLVGKTGGSVPRP